MADLKERPVLSPPRVLKYSLLPEIQPILLLLTKKMQEIALSKYKLPIFSQCKVHECNFALSLSSKYLYIYSVPHDFLYAFLLLISKKIFNKYVSLAKHIPLFDSHTTECPLRRLLVWTRKTCFTSPYKKTY